MLRLPRRYVTEAARRNIARFCATSAAKDFEEDKHEWRIVEWTWEEGPPLRLVVRSEVGDVWDFIMDDSGAWRIERDANVPRQAAP
jgi:hypothetical protein